MFLNKLPSFFLLFSFLIHDCINAQINQNNSINSAPIRNEKSEYCYNEIPQGVQLISSEEDWLTYSPVKPCCCYPNFNSQNKRFGLLYNHKAFQLIKGNLQGENKDVKVCSKENWNDILYKIENDVNQIQTLQLNTYPGYFDQLWFLPDYTISGYWYDDNSMISFSNDNYGEAMIDDNLYNDEDINRQSIVALSIRLIITTKVDCDNNKWISNVIYPKGMNNSIRFISSQNDWNKNNEKKESKIEPACCYINFDIKYQSFGYLYNRKAYEILKNDSNLQTKGYRVATESDWNKMIRCCRENGFLNSIYKCQDENYDGIITPNGYFDGKSAHFPEEMKSSYWVGEKNSQIIYNFDCNSVGTVKTTMSNGNNSDAYFIKFIKL
jgi:hypothetical protein